MFRVMLADDEPIMRKALQTLIDWKSIECEVVSIVVNGDEAVAELDRLQPDILITDVMMPGRDGIELAKYIWENKLSTKVIILTAYADFSYAQSAVRYNVVEYVTKTGALEILVKAVEKCKGLIREEQKQTDPESIRAKEENFFKGIFDGSIDGEEEVRERAASIQLQMGGYRLLLIRFLMEGGIDQKRTGRMQKSLYNFFMMAFKNNMPFGFFLKRDLFAAVIQSDSEAEKQEMEAECIEIANMMDSFMELYVYIGISDHHETVAALRAAYEEAEAALQHGMMEHSENINFYQTAMQHEEEAAETATAKQQLVRDCLDYIEKYSKEPISVAVLAKEIGTSASYLSRIFKETTGMTIIQTINQAKVNQAKQYLKTTDLKVYEIADRLGFENTTYFSRFFKKHTGYSPKEYAGKHEKE